MKNFIDLLDAALKPDATSKPKEILEQTVFIIGPELIKDGNQSLTRIFFEKLMSQFQADSYNHDSNNELNQIYQSPTLTDQERLFLIAQLANFDRNSLIPLANGIYNSKKSNAQLDKLSQIPVPLYISSTNDTMLLNAFESNRIDHFHNYFVFTKNSKSENLWCSADKPLIYGIFGFILDSSSLILRYDDLFNYLLRIDNRIPTKLIQWCNSTKYYIFLGFNFKDWHLKVIMSLLELQGKSRGYSYQLDKLNSTDSLFYKEYYKLVFVEDDSSNFIEELYSFCKEENLLRNKKADISIKLIEKVNSIISKGQGKKSFTKLIDTIRSFDIEKKFDNEITLILGQFNINERERRLGKIASSEYHPKLIQQIQAIQFLSEEIEDYYNHE